MKERINCQYLPCISKSLNGGIRSAKHSIKSYQHTDDRDTEREYNLRSIHTLLIDLIDT